MYHTSPNEIKSGTIHSYGVAGSCLFFSNDIYQMSDAAIYVYKADFNCVESSDLFDAEIIAEITEEFAVDSDTAENLLDGSESEWNYDCDETKSWWLQGKRGECAVKMGYDGCKDTDEQGTVYIIPMLGRESELTLAETL